MDFFKLLKQRTQEAILANFSKADEIPDVNEPPVHPDTYRPPSIETKKENDMALKLSNNMIKDIFNAITSTLSTQHTHEHLLHAQYGSDVDIRAYWMRAGFGEAKPRGAVFPDPDSIRFQFDDKASYQIKCKDPLRPVKSVVP
jgi:hypothetical protein